MSAFEQAVAESADGIEFDVRFTADRQWVVHHDPAIPASGEPVRIADLRTADIAKLRVGPRAEPIPTLAEFLAWAKNQDVSLIIDIKDRTGVSELIAAIETAQLTIPPVFSSFHKSVVQELRHERPAWRSALIVGNPRWRMTRRFLVGALLRWARKHQLHSLSLHERWVTPRLVQHLQNEGINLAVWTVDDPDRMAVLARLGVNAIITNRPGLGRESVDRFLAGSGNPVQS